MDNLILFPNKLTQFDANMQIYKSKLTNLKVDNQTWDICLTCYIGHTGCNIIVTKSTCNHSINMRRIHFVISFTMMIVL